MTFKVGDQVRTKTEDQYNGLVGEIRGTDSDGGFIVTTSTSPGFTSTLPFNKNELELIKDEEMSAVNPSHYDFGGVQVIDITRHMDFPLGNVVKYVTRAGRKGDKLEDLLKAQTYLSWAIEDAQK